MPVSVAIYDKALTRVGDRLDALGLDIALHPFDGDGRFVIAGERVAPSEVDIDFLWLSPDINNDGKEKAAFELILACRSLGVIQTYNAGLDKPVYRDVAAKGVRICNSSAQAVAISEYVLAQVLNLFHPMQERRDLQARKEWKLTPFREISRSNWLIVGFGPIGRAIAERSKAFGASNTVVRRAPATSDTVDRAGTIADLAQLLPDADIIVIACPLNDQTRGLVDDAFLAAVKPGAVLVNIARGAIVDDAALIKALDEERLSAAILDVFHTEPLPRDDPLWSHPKVQVTAHTSFAGRGTRYRWEQLFLDNLARFVNGEPLLNEVDPADIL